MAGYQHSVKQLFTAKIKNLRYSDIIQKIDPVLRLIYVQTGNK